MTLNPAFQPILAAFAPLADLDWNTLPPAQARAMMDQPVAGPEPQAVERVENLTLDLEGRQIKARLYVSASAGDKPPLILFFHGGGWVIGTLETHDTTCRELAENSGVAVLSIDYRLAPEHPYPAPLEDGFEILQIAAKADNPFGTDPARIGVAGDSAGGNIAAALSIYAKERNGPAIRHQLLLYPVTNDDFETESYQKLGSGEYFLTTDSMKFFWRHYLSGQKTESLAAVLQHKDLGGLPPATIITAEYDPLRDEGEAYASRLREAGVSVESHRAPGMIHGFLGMTAMVPDAAEWAKKAGEAASKALRT